MGKELVEELDEIINQYKEHPELYDDNVYVCYESCKNLIRKMEREHIINTQKEYDNLISYVTEKLDI